MGWDRRPTGASAIDHRYSSIVFVKEKEPAFRSAQAVMVRRAICNLTDGLGDNEMLSTSNEIWLV